MNTIAQLPHPLTTALTDIAVSDAPPYRSETQRVGKECHY